MPADVSASVALAVVVPPLALVGMVVPLVRALRAEGRERDWPAGRATVLGTRPWVHSEAPLRTAAPWCSPGW